MDHRRTALGSATLTYPSGGVRICCVFRRATAFHFFGFPARAVEVLPLGFLPGFEEDVFISYAHNDDDQYGREKRGWVAQLHADLEERVKYYLGQPPRLWRDSEIRNNDDFDRKIKGRLPKTATFLSVISHNFLQREWCQRELELFTANAKQNFGLQVGDKRRIFKAEKYSIPRSTLPPQLDGTGVYKFYGIDPEPPNNVHEFRPSLGEQQWKLYFEQMDTLAQDIAATLRLMRQETQGAAPAPQPGETVYLAETTSDQDEARSRIRKDLQDRKITVLPEGSLPYRGLQFEDQVRQSLARSVLSIHIFGKEYGFVPEGRQRPHTWLQHDLAMERGRENPDFTRIIWLPKDVLSVDDRQREFIDLLQNDARVQQGAEILQDRLEDLKTEVLRQLDQLEKRREEKSRAKLIVPAIPSIVSNTPAGSSAAGAPGAASEDPRTIYLICDPQDFESPALLALNGYLLDQGYEPLKSVVSADPEEARRTHEDYLQICDAYLIFFGAAPEQWVSAKLTDFLKFRSKRETPVLAKSVYLAPPDTASKRAFRTNQAKVLQGGPAFSPDALEPFLEALRKPKESPRA
jgi:hypothetical protein